MPRPIILYTGTWADLTLPELAAKAGEWGYQGLELCCWGDHFEIQRALSEPDYCRQKLDLLGQHDLSLAVLSNHRVGQAVGDVIDDRHRMILPEYVWGDGDPEGVRQRATEEMLATIQAAQKLGLATVAGFTGSPVWGLLFGYPVPDASFVDRALRSFVRQWQPILDACRDAGIRFALEVHPGQVAFDFHSAEMMLELFDGREELGFTFDPSHFHWQGVDPVEFLRRFPERIFHVHIKDAALSLNGRNGLLCSHLPPGDPRRGWDYRAPGHGGIDWEAVIRTLNAIGYDGPLSVEFKDPGMDRDHGAEEACKFVKRLNFEPAPGMGGAFHTQ